MRNRVSIRRIAAACEGIVRRSDEIVRQAELDDRKLAALFEKNEIRDTNNVCCELLLSVAESESVADLIANRENFERMRKHVMAANDVLTAHTQVNPQTMSSIMNAEDTLIDLLVAADPTVRLMAGFAQRHLGIVKSVLTSFFMELRLLLEVDCEEGLSWVKRLRGALSSPVGSMVLSEGGALVAKYGSPRDERESAIAFMRSLYDKKSPKFSSWPKVVGYVRGCRDEADANFARCAKIRAQVQTWAKPGKDGPERVWHSLAQQLKLSHGKKSKSGLGLVAIPDRSWS